MKLVSAIIKPFKLQVSDITEGLPTAFIKPVTDTIPYWEYQSPNFDTDLHDILSKKTDNPHFMLSSSLSYSCI